MSAPGRRWAKAHHDLRDRLPPKVYGNDALLAAWLKLLVLGDAVWPAVADRPHTVRQRRLEELAAVDVVVLDPGESYRYRIPALDIERLDEHRQGRESVSRRKDRADLPPSPVEGDIHAFYARAGRTLGRDLGRHLGTTNERTNVRSGQPPPLPDGAAPDLSPEAIAEAERQRILALHPNDARRREYERKNGLVE